MAAMVRSKAAALASHDGRREAGAAPGDLLGMLQGFKFRWPLIGEEPDITSDRMVCEPVLPEGVGRSVTPASDET